MINFQNNEDSDDKEETKNIGSINRAQLCGSLDDLMGDKDAQVETTKV